MTTRRALLPAVFFLAALYVGGPIRGAEAQNETLTIRPIRVLHCPRVEMAPVIDGRLDDEIWQKAARATNFVLTTAKKPKPAKHQTIAYLAYDDQWLYVAFSCDEPDTAGLKRRYQAWDSWDRDDIFWDDRVEIFLDVDHDHRSYYHLVLNPNGVQFDEKCFRRLPGSRTCDFDPSWNGFWRARTSVQDGKWVAEIAIAFSSFGSGEPVVGTTWGINLCRVRQPAEKSPAHFARTPPQPRYPTEYSAWVYVHDSIRETVGNFHEPIQFGDLVFGAEGPDVVEIAFRSARFSYGPIGHPSLFGTNPLRLRVVAHGERPRALRVTTTTLSPSGKAVNDWKTVRVSPGDTALIQTVYHIWEEGENKLTVTLLDGESPRQFYRATYILTCPPFIEFDLEPFYSREANPKPVRAKLVTSPDVLREARLHLSLLRQGVSIPFLDKEFTNLKSFQELQPIFALGKLRDLPGGNYVIKCKLLDREGRVLGRFDQHFTKIDPAVPDTFAVFDGPYTYGGYTDHAVQVVFPFPARFVFWRLASYVPWWDVDQAAYSYEFVECWGGGCQGCCEPMQDKTCRYSQVEVLEASEARVVIHWRYAVGDAHYKIFYNEWVDEYYVFYPDGVGVREVNLWANRSTRHELSEALLVNPPGVRSRQLYDEEFCTLSNLSGQSYTNRQLFEKPDLYERVLATWKDFIFQAHFKNRPRPFLVFSLRDDLLPGVSPNTVTIGSRVIQDYGQRGHWPVNPWHIDGFNLVGLYRPYHGNIGYIQAEVDRDRQPTTWRLLIGVEPKGSFERIASFARSWLYPPQARVQTPGFGRVSYHHRERAYVVEPADPSASEATDCSVLVEASAERPLLDPVFVIQGWASPCSEIVIDGQRIPRNRFRSAPTLDGHCLVYLEGQFSHPTRFVFRRSP